MNTPLTSVHVYAILVLYRASVMWYGPSLHIVPLLKGSEPGGQTQPKLPIVFSHIIGAIQSCIPSRAASSHSSMSIYRRVYYNNTIVINHMHWSMCCSYNVNVPMQDLSSGPSLNPSLQSHTNDPLVLLHSWSHIGGDI